MSQDVGNPTLYVIAGPNGAGKTTFARKFLPTYADCRQFVNADLIALGLAPFAPDTVALRAGRLALERIEDLSRRRLDFGLETTLSGKTYAALFRRLREEGYAIHLLLLWLPDVELAVARVADRVRRGGHQVPEGDVRRRHERVMDNFIGVYREWVDSWCVFDNSREVPRRLQWGGIVPPTPRPDFSAGKGAIDAIEDSLLEPVVLVCAEQALREAVAATIEDHRRTGDPLAIWRDGKVVLAPAEELIAATRTERP